MSKRVLLALLLSAVCWPRLAAADSCPVLPDAQRLCQETVAKAGSVYAKLTLKAMQLCLKKIQTGDLPGDPLTVCRGTPGVPPTDPQTADKLTTAAGKVLSIMQTKCTDTDVAALGLCDPTVAGLAGCLVVDHAPLLDAAIEAEFGAVAQTGNEGEQTCQATVAKESGKYLTKYLKTVQKCQNARTKKECALDAPVSKCLSPSLTGPKAEAKAAKKIEKARAKFAEKINLSCNDTQVSALDTCGSATGALIDCILCQHTETAGVLAGGEYASVLVADTGTGIQAVVDQADEGDTIIVQPGTYTETVEIKDSGVSLIGLTCSGRAVIESPNPGVTPDGVTACGRYAPSCPDVADDLLFQGLEVNDFEDNALLIVGVEGVAFRDVITRGNGTASGMEYGPFPILSNNVLVEDSEVTGVRDAGIYVGQSTNITVRNNVVFDNVAGIEIENSANAVVHGNQAYDNTGGILVFKLPGLGVQLSNCAEVFDNSVLNNNTPNFGSGTVGLVPTGTGILILSGDTVHVHDNTVNGNDTFGLVVTDQGTLNVLNPGNEPFPTLSPDPLVDDNFYRNNTFSGNGTNPDPGSGGASGDVVYAALSGGSGSCHGGNTFTTGSFAPLPVCTLTAPPGCPLDIVPTTTSTVTTTSTSTSTTLPASFAAIHAAVLDGSCGGCHGGSGGLSGLGDCNTAIANLVDMPSVRLPTMDRIEPGDSANSFLVHKLEGTQGAFNAMCTGGGGNPCGFQMPLGGPFLAQHIIDSLKAWIDAGATNDCP